MSVLKLIKARYNQLKPVQKKIAEYFLDANFESINASIESVAKKTGTSVASISRFCKKLDFGSFQHFKITLSRDLKYEPDTVLPIFRMDDDPDLIIRKVFSEAITNLQATEGSVSFDSIKRIVEKIKECKHIYFFGLGGSGAVGCLGELLFSHIGYSTNALLDPYAMIVKAGHADARSLIFGLSHSGRTRSVIDGVRIGKERGAYTVGITNYPKSPLATVTDITLLTASHERRMHFAQSNSMVVQITLLQTMYILTASRSKDSTIERVNSIEKNVNLHVRSK